MHNTKIRLRSAFAGLAGAVAIAGLASFAGGDALAQAMQPKVDDGHTSVHFAIWHGGFTKVMGEFRKVEITEFAFDPADVSKSKVVAKVDAASLDTNHYYRDNYTRSETFLNVIKHPMIEFTSTKVWKTGENTGKMTGDLAMRGVTKPVTFDIVYNKGGKHLSGKYWIDGFTATGTIKRSDFDIKAFIPWVADEVELTLTLEWNREVQEAKQ